MDQQAEGPGIVCSAFFNAQKDVSGHEDGRVGDKGVEVATLIQCQVLLGRAEEHLNAQRLP